MGKVIALVGNPNSGKTTMFNSLTGSNQYVGNWPGVTVEKKEGRLKDYPEVILTDLPGIYSLSPYSLEEVITRNYLLDDKVNLIINIIDATNIERNLYLTTQILEMDKPVIIALNFVDVVSKRGIKIDLDKLSKELGCPVVLTSALKNQGLKELQDLAVSYQEKRIASKFAYSMNLIKAIERIKNVIDVDNQFIALKLLDKDEIYFEKYQNVKEKIDAIIDEYEKAIDNDSQTGIVEERYKIIEKIVQKCVDAKNSKETISDKIDNIVTNKILAIPIFLIIMFIVYYIAIVSVGDIATTFMETLFTNIGEVIRTLLQKLSVSSWLEGLIVDGVVSGVGAVLTFIPQMIILFIFLSLLEDSGYMARVAFIMDSIFRKFGLSGKSFIPMLIGTGCSVPGIMASRTIENERDRKMTIMLTPFIPCGAKLPVFALFIGVFFGPFASVSMYLLGFVVVIITGLILKRFKYFKDINSPFILELPEYHLPSVKNITIHVWDRVKAFIVKAGTIIFAASAIIWMLQSFSWDFRMVSAENSILGSIGKLIAPIFTPLGFNNWQSSVAILTGIAAKENIVATFEIISGDPVQLVSTIFTPISGYAFMAFFLLSAPCLAAIGATKKELGSWKQTLITITMQTSIAYIVALIIYQGGNLLQNSKHLSTIIISLVLGLLIIFAIRKAIKSKGCLKGCGNCSSSCCDNKKTSR
ncbi:MAG TPA: ferrous iron transport protein B [Bacilli bacterium]